MTAASKVGRPTKGNAPMTTAQRAEAFRRNRYEQAGQAHEHLDSASTAVLLSALARQIKSIQNDIDHAPVARDVAARIISELCSRHEITLT